MIPSNITKEFTLEEMALALDMDAKVVTYYADRYAIPRFKKEIDGKLRTIFPYTSYIAIKARKEKPVVQKKKVEVQTANFDELKKLHPLVTDERCFRLSWFPENVLHACDDSEWRGY